MNDFGLFILGIVVGLIIASAVLFSNMTFDSTLVESGRCEFRTDPKTGESKLFWKDTGEIVGRERK